MGWRGHGWTKEQLEKRSEKVLQRYREKYLGTEYTSNDGYKCKLVVYRNAMDCDFLFDDDTLVTHKSIYNARKGEIKNPNTKTKCNIGFLGENNNVKDETKPVDKFYNKKRTTWEAMLNRCYDKRMEEINPSYNDCFVSEEFQNRSLFFKWFDENYYEIYDETMCLDKDILIKGNKIYSSDACIFVPERINMLFVKGNRKNKDLPIGVRRVINKNIGDRYEANCAIRKEYKKTISIYLGRYNTPEDAFYAYKKYKEEYIKQVADEYKDKIPQKLYDAMYNYKVEITD